MNSQVIKVQSVVSLKTIVIDMTATSEVRLNDLNKIENISGTINLSDKYIGSFNASSNQMDNWNLNISINVSDSTKLTEATEIVNKIVEDIGLLYPVKP